LTEEDWDRTMAVNLKGVFLCMKYELQAMRSANRQHRVDVGRSG
jgi:NAD(P)-dependent dehydrogenase (short-subunit alcohol dehydrogenase family)